MAPKKTVGERLSPPAHRGCGAKRPTHQEERPVFLQGPVHQTMLAGGGGSIRADLGPFALDGRGNNQTHELLMFLAPRGSWGFRWKIQTHWGFGVSKPGR